MKRYRAFLIFFILVLNGLTTSLTSEALELKFDELSPIVIPNCILQDSFGFIWIGAQEGLLRYDGYDFKRYRQIPFDSTSLSNNWVMAVQEDSLGNLWVGTFGGGLNYFNQRTGKFTRFLYETEYEHMSSSLNITSIVVNGDGSLWLGTEHPGLIHMQINRLGNPVYRHIDLNSNIDPSSSPGENFVLTLYQDREGDLWIGTMGGGLKFLDTETGKITHFRHDPDKPSGISHNTVSSICEDDSGNLWIGTGHILYRFGNGLNRFDRKTQTFAHYNKEPADPYSLGSDLITSLLIDSTGMMWIGTLGAQLSYIPVKDLLSKQQPRFQHYREFDRGNINCLYEDHLGNIYVGLFGRAVHRYNRQQNRFIWYRYKEGDPKSIWSSAAMVQVDKAGNIWFGGGALDCYSPKTGRTQHFIFDPDNPDGLNNATVTSICQDNNGFYWIGTGKGLNRLNPETGRIDHITEDPNNPSGLRSNMVTEVLTDQTGNLWIASGKTGIQRYIVRENRFISFDLDSSSSAGKGITGIFEDQSGTLWCQTFNRGFYSLRIDENKIEHIEHYIHSPKDKESLGCNCVTDIIRPRIADTTGLWVATSNGLNRLELKTGKFTHYYTENGLPSNDILKVLEDDEGNIWCSCATGLAKVNIDTKEIKSYSEYDGMPVAAFASRSQNACKTPDGQLIFGAAIGALGFYPDEIKINKTAPPVYFTDFRIFNQPVPLDSSIQFKKRITLSHDQNMFSFDFVALNYINPNKNQYAYKMKNVFDEWISLEGTRSVSFTNLNPGAYTFQVKGSNNHGVWNENGAQILVVVDPPFWRTAWFRIAIGSLFFTILVLSIRYTAIRKYKAKLRVLEYQQRMNHERERISRDMHDEVGANLTRIAILSEIAQKRIRAADEGRKQLEEISNTSRDVVDNIGEIIWAINPENDALDNLVAYIRQYISKFFEDTGVVCTLDFPTETEKISLSAEFRRNIFLVTKEAATNILKHAQASETSFKITIKDNKMDVEIKDNGIGCSPEYNIILCNGLENMRKRIERTGGRWNMKSEPGQGTIIEFSVSLDGKT